MKKRIISLLLCFCMILGFTPITTSYALTAPNPKKGYETLNVQESITALQRVFPAGSFFTVTGKSCSHKNDTFCSNCTLSNIMSAMGYSSLSTYDIRDSYTCVSFAKFAFWYIFGVGDDTFAYSGSAPSGASVVSLSNAKLGDMVVFSNGHYAIYLDDYVSDGTTYVKIYDANGALDTTGEVTIRNRPYPSGSYIVRADNYDEINGGSSSSTSSTISTVKTSIDTSTSTADPDISYEVSGTKGSYGIYYGTSKSAVQKGTASKASLGSLGSFSFNGVASNSTSKSTNTYSYLTGKTPEDGTTYYVATYAVDGAGDVIIGNVVEFTTPAKAYEVEETLEIFITGEGDYISLDSSFSGAASDYGIYSGTSQSAVKNRTASYYNYGELASMSAAIKSTRLTTLIGSSLTEGSTYYFMAYKKSTTGQESISPVISYTVPKSTVPESTVTTVTPEVVASPVEVESISVNVENSAMPTVTFKTKGEITEYGVFFDTNKSTVEKFDGTQIKFKENVGRENSWLTSTIYFAECFSGFSQKGGSYYIMPYAVDTDGNYVKGTPLSFDMPYDEVVEQVVPEVETVVSVTSVKVSPTMISMSKGGTMALTATVSPSNATNSAVTWSSSDTSVATVSSTGVVTGKGEGSVKITATSSDGNRVGTCSVIVTDNGNSSTTTTTTTTVVTPSITVTKPSTDSTHLNGVSSWAEDLVDRAYTLGLLDGMTDVMNNYQGEINREQFCRLIMNTYDVAGGKRPSSVNSKFTDTANQEVIHANALGIVSGTSDSTFSPSNHITRQELAIMVLRLSEHFETITGLTSSLAFSDAFNVSDWAKTAVYYAQREGFLAGSDGMILPLDNLTCEQAVIVSLRVAEKFA